MTACAKALARVAPRAELSRFTRTAKLAHKQDGPNTHFERKLSQELLAHVAPHRRSRQQKAAGGFVHVLRARATRAPSAPTAAQQRPPQTSHNHAACTVTRTKTDEGKKKTSNKENENMEKGGRKKTGKRKDTAARVLAPQNVVDGVQCLLPEVRPRTGRCGGATCSATAAPTERTPSAVSSVHRVPLRVCLCTQPCQLSPPCSSGVRDTVGNRQLWLCVCLVRRGVTRTVRTLRCSSAPYRTMNVCTAAGGHDAHVRWFRQYQWIPSASCRCCP